MKIPPRTATSGATAEIERIRFVSATFHELQGWRQVLAGLMLMQMSNAGINALFLFFRVIPLSAVHPVAGPILEVELSLGWFASLWIVSWWVGRHYDERFGRVEPRRSSLGWPASAFVLYYGCALLGYLNRWSGLGVSFPALGMAYYFGTRRGAWKERPHHGAVALIFLAASVVPLATGPFLLWGPAQPVTFQGILQLVLGLGLVVTGLLDHALLVRSLPAPPAAGPAPDGEELTPACDPVSPGA